MWSLLKGKFASWLIKNQLVGIVTWLANMGVDIDKAVNPMQGGVRFPLHTQIVSFFMGNFLQSAQLLQAKEQVLTELNKQFEQLYRDTHDLMPDYMKHAWESRVGKPAPAPVLGQPADAVQGSAAPVAMTAVAGHSEAAVDAADAASAAGVGSGA